MGLLAAAMGNDLLHLLKANADNWIDLNLAGASVPSGSIETKPTEYTRSNSRCEDSAGSFSKAELSEQRGDRVQQHGCGSHPDQAA